jgi:hypothetical protein
MIARLIALRFASFIGVVAMLAVMTMPLSAATKKRKSTDTPPAAPDTPADPSKAIPATDEEKAGHSPHQSLASVFKEQGAGGVVSYWFASGDAFTGKDSPDTTHHGLDIEAQFDYDPARDANGTVISQGDPQLGWAIHFVDGKPSFTINYEGLRTTLHADEVLTTTGRVTLRGLLGLDGTLGLNVTGLKNGARGYAPMYNGLPRKPEQGLEIGHGSRPLPHETYPNSASFNGTIAFVRLSLLPATPPGFNEKPSTPPTPPKASTKKSKSKSN